MKRETRRYGIAFAVLLVLLGGLLIWNLNAGSFPMTASQVLAILFGQGGGSDYEPHHLGYPSAADFGGGASGRRTVDFRLFTADIFRQSHCQPLCAGDFLRCQTDRGTDYDFSPPAGDSIQFLCADWVSLCGGHAVHGVCAPP